MGDGFWTRDAQESRPRCGRCPHGAPSCGAPRPGPEPGGQTHLRDGVGEEAVELLVGAVPHPAPPGRVEVLPDAPQADGHPLAQEGVGVAELLQADGDQVALQAGLLGGAGDTSGRLTQPGSPPWRFSGGSACVPHFKSLRFQCTPRAPAERGGGPSGPLGRGSPSPQGCPFRWTFRMTPPQPLSAAAAAPRPVASGRPGCGVGRGRRHRSPARCCSC